MPGILLAERLFPQLLVGGSTALVDAIGTAVDHIKEVHKYIRKEDIPDHTIFIITTDGLENASHIYSSDKVKKMIEAQKEIGWEFLFLGQISTPWRLRKGLVLMRNTR